MSDKDIESVIIMLAVIKNEMQLNEVSFGTHKLAIEDAKELLENNGWIATK